MVPTLKQLLHLSLSHRYNQMLTSFAIALLCLRGSVTEHLQQAHAPVAKPVGSCQHPQYHSLYDHCSTNRHLHD